jgi:tetratricopeptide (TPR) repeat protein
MGRVRLRHVPVACGVALLAVAACAHPASARTPDATEAARLRARALEHGFNLDHAEALATFNQAVAANPSDPASHRLAAATLWIHALFQQGAITADDYLGRVRAKVDRKPVSPGLAAAFRAHLDRALTLAEQRVRVNPRDAEAHFQVGAAHGFLASYTATIEGRVMGGFGAARRAYREHSRVLQLDPTRKDAGLVVGMYRYAVSMLPWHWRLLADLAGFDGGRETGVRLVEEAAAHASDVQPNALFTLIVIYNREGRYDDALRVIGQLQQRYPRNRLLWLEAGTTALRAGRFTSACEALEQGLAKLAADPRPRAFGEDARWRYAYGAALAALGRIEPAQRELRMVLTTDAPAWLRGRAHNELGKISDVAGNRAAALAAFREADRLCRADRDAPCVDEASKRFTTVQVRHDRP